MWTKAAEPGASRSWLDNAVLIGLYNVLTASVIGVVAVLSSSKGLSWDSFLRFDALHYQWIAEHGYADFRQAFFPLFPLLWRILTVEVWTAVAMNGTLYLLALITLGNSLRIDRRTLLMFCSTPTAVFFFVPYTESLFFVGSAVLLIGHSRQERGLIFMGYLIACTSRPVFTALLPAVVLATWLAGNDRRSIYHQLIPAAGGVALALAMVTMVQYRDTGEFLGFYHAQSGWGNTFGLPTMPLTSWGGGWIVMLDAAALLIGCIAGLLTLRMAYTKWTTGSSNEPFLVALSTGYLASVSLLVLLIHGGELYSLGRFVFCSPFLIVLLWRYLPRWSQGTIKRHVLTFGVLVLFFLLFGSYVHIQTFLRFLALAGLLAVIPISCYTKGPWVWSAMVGALLWSVQIYFALHFLDGGWVG
ncbi:MAG: hypothetical protein KDB88_11045 [Flavobacteriales bacterium]|nr:hypothetical protein [Flavobacteriales bacterium]